MTNNFDKAIHKFADMFHLTLDFQIELSDQDILDDLTYGQDGLRLPMDTALKPKELR